MSGCARSGRGRRARCKASRRRSCRGAANAESWPTRALHVIVPFGAGSTTDIVPRAVFEQLAPQLGQSTIVENRVGAGGTVGTEFVARADPDGYTILVNSNAHTIAPALYPHLTYDVAGDFAGVIPLGTQPNVLVVSPAKGFKTVHDFVAAAKAKPGALTFSSVGVGSGTHFSAERFRASAGVEAVHVPFNSGAAAMTEVMAGRIDFFFGPVGIVLPFAREGKLTALVVNGDKRSAALPDVPTTAEAGFPDAVFPSWWGVFLPAKTPAKIVRGLHDETLKVLQTPSLRAKLDALGVDPMIMTPNEFDAYVKKDIAINASLAKADGIKAE